MMYRLTKAEFYFRLRRMFVNTDLSGCDLVFSLSEA